MADVTFKQGQVSIKQNMFVELYPTRVGERTSPSNTRRVSNVGSMLVHRMRRWPSIEPTLGERLEFAGSRHRWLRQQADTGCSPSSRIRNV